MKLFTYSSIILLTFGFLFMSYLVGTRKITYITVPLESVTVPIDETRLFKAVNEFRTKEGLSVYTENSRSCELASQRVNDIQTEFSHRLFFSRVIVWEQVSENLSIGFPNETEIVHAWVYSRTHRENLLKPYPKSCIRCVSNRCVQIFTY